jgi:replicative DNA helicase
MVAKAWEPKPARIVTLSEVPAKGDVSDYLRTHTPQQLLEALRAGEPPPAWLDVEGQLAASAADDAEAMVGRRIWLSLPAVDETVNGVRRGEVCGLMARPGIGKTLFLTHITQGVAEREDVGHVMFSLEMPAAQIVARLQQRLYGVMRHKREELARQGRLELDRYRRTFTRFVLVDTPGLSVAQMEGVLRQIAAGPLKDSSIGLVTIDHLGLIGGDRKLSTYDRVSVQAREIKELAKRFQCAVMLAVQVNRDAGGDGSRELGLGSARDSGVVEEAMDYLIGLRRPDRNLELSLAERERVRDLIVAKVIKNRHGEVGPEVAYRFHPQGLTLTEDRDVRTDADSIAHIATSRYRR